MPEMPPPEASLSLCSPLVPKLSELKPDELDTLQAAINNGDFKTVVDKAPCTDFEAISYVKKLMKSGYLEVVGGSGSVA